MKNYTYNGLNAHDIAGKIIENEEAYLSIDFDSLSFEDKCRFAYRHNAAKHPLYKLIDLEDKFLELYDELLRRTKNKEDSFCLYHLAVLSWILKPYRDQVCQYLDRACVAGSLNARLLFVDWFCKDDNRKREIVDDVLNVLSLGNVTEQDEYTLYHAYGIMERIAQTPDDRNHYRKLSDELALKHVLKGEYATLTHLCVKDQDADEKLFWKTVKFIVNAEFYDKYSVYISDGLGMCLLRGIGCEPDFERAKRFYLDVYFRKQADTERLLEVLGINDSMTLDKAKQSLKCDVDNGDAEGFKKLMLISILQKEAKTIEELFDKAVESCPEKLPEIMNHTYNKLCKCIV